MAKAAELSGLTVVGSTVIDPNAGREKEKGRFYLEYHEVGLTYSKIIFLKQELYYCSITLISM